MPQRLSALLRGSAGTDDALAFAAGSRADVSALASRPDAFGAVRRARADLDEYEFADA